MSIVPCHLLNDATGDAGDPSRPTPGPPPSTLPPNIPAHLVPADATVYALVLEYADFEPGVPSTIVDVIYTVGPAGSGCTATWGNYVEIWITDPAGAPTGHVHLPHGGYVSYRLSCPYVPAAEAAYRAEDAAYRASLAKDPYPPPPGTSPGRPDPAVACRAQPGERVTTIDTAVPHGYLALVTSAPPTANAATNRKVALYTYQEGPDVADGLASEADCTLPASQQAVCVAELAFFLAQSLQLTDMTDAGRAGIYAQLADLVPQ